MKSYKQQRQQWIRRAVETYNYHINKLKLHPTWTIAHTSELLGRSYGSVAEDLLIARWLRTHEDKIRSFSRAYQAIAFIRAKQKELNVRDFELD